jgi:hypothetical protein
VLALAVFGAIILFHYCDPWLYQGQLEFGAGGAWHGGHYQRGSIEPLIADVRMPLFVLAVVYAGLFFLVGGKDAEPVPRRPRDWRRIKVMGVILAALLVLAGLIAMTIYSQEEEKRTQAKLQADNEYEASKHRITQSEIDLIDLRLGHRWGSSYNLIGRIRNRAAHNSTLNSIKLVMTLREREGSPDILGQETVQINVQVPSHQTREINQDIYFTNAPQLTQFTWGYYIAEIRGSKGQTWQDAPIVKDFDPDKFLREHASPNP